MTVGLAPGVAQDILNSLARGEAWTPPAGFFCKLHTGDPGVAGTANAFGDTTRKEASFADAGSDGICETDADMDWTNVSAAGTVSHISFWDAVTGGVFQGSDALGTARTLDIGDNFTILAGDGQLSLAPLAA